MIRTIEGFRSDERSDWIAELSCLHCQHVRHQPPFRDRPWVTTEAGRADHIGAELDCPLCDRAELPAGLELARTAGPFDAETLPTGLRRPHVVADRTWGVLRVLAGAVRFTMETALPIDVTVHSGEEHAIPPGVRHAVVLGDGAQLAVDFYVTRRT